MKLYEIAESYNDLIGLMEDEDLDLREEDVLKALEVVEEELQDKVVSIGKVITNKKASVDARKKLIKKLKNENDRDLKSIEYLKNYIKFAMESMSMKKITTPTIKVFLRVGPPSVLITDKEKIPFDYLILQESKINKESILRELKKGTEFDFAEIKRNTSVVIS